MPSTRSLAEARAYGGGARRPAFAARRIPDSAHSESPARCTNTGTAGRAGTPRYGTSHSGYEGVSRQSHRGNPVWSHGRIARVCRNRRSARVGLARRCPQPSAGPGCRSALGGYGPGLGVRDENSAPSVPHPSRRRVPPAAPGGSNRLPARREPCPSRAPRAQTPSVHRQRAATARPEGKACRTADSGRDRDAREPGDAPSVVPRPGGRQVRR
jgi:hypothetical protein